jgi:hypothetical protein
MVNQKQADLGIPNRFNITPSRFNAAGERPRLDLGCFVGGVVVYDDMDSEPLRDLSIDLFEELQELDRPVTLVTNSDIAQENY